MEIKKTKVTIYIKEDLLKRLDVNIALKKEGFTSRTQVINDMLSKYLSNDMVLDANSPEMSKNKKDSADDQQILDMFKEI